MKKYKNLEELIRASEKEAVLMFQKGNIIPVPKTRSSEVQEHSSLQSYTMPHHMRQRKETAEEKAKGREKRILNSVEARKTPWTRNNWREKLAAETAATGDKLSLQQIPVIGKYVPDMLDATASIGNMASALGSAPLRAKQSNSLAPYATAVGMPLVAGALAGIGARTNLQFANNVANPLAGISNVPGILKPSSVAVRPKPPVVNAQLRAPAAELHIDINAPAKPRVVHGLYDDFDPNGTIARYDPRLLSDISDHSNFMDEFVDNSIIKPTSVLAKAKEYSKTKLISADRKIGSVLDRSQKLPSLSSVVDDANVRLTQGLGVNKTKNNVQLKYVDRNSIDVLVNGHTTGSLDMASMEAQRRSLTELLRIKKARKELVNQFGHSNSMFENAAFQGYAKQGDFPFSKMEKWGDEEILSKFGPGVDTFRSTGISGEINKAISESLKSKKSRLYSGGTGHSDDGQIRYNGLELKGLVENITGRSTYGGNIYMYKKRGGKLNK